MTLGFQNCRKILSQSIFPVKWPSDPRDIVVLSCHRVPGPNTSLLHHTSSLRVGPGSHSELERKICQHSNRSLLVTVPP